MITSPYSASETAAKRGWIHSQRAMRSTLTVMAVLSLGSAAVLAYSQGPAKAETLTANPQPR